MRFGAGGMKTYYTAECDGAGICHISGRRTNRPPILDIRVAWGVDALLCVLVKLAAELADEELEDESAP